MPNRSAIPTSYKPVATAILKTVATLRNLNGLSQGCPNFLPNGQNYKFKYFIESQKHLNINIFETEIKINFLITSM